MNNSIHPLSIISNDVTIGTGVSIHPYAIVENDVKIGNNVTIASHAIIRSGTRIEDHVLIDSFAVIGGNPQDLKFDTHIRSGVLIKMGSQLREGVTVHRATRENAYTIIGDNAFLMANAHVAHDCIVGSHVKLANGVLLGGFVTIDDHTFIGGSAVLHQHIHIGEGVMIAGRAALSIDIPPFLMVSELNRIPGLNFVGLKRRGATQEDISAIKRCFRAVLGSSGNAYQHATTLRSKGEEKNAFAETFLRFFEERGPRGCVNFRHVRLSKE